MIVQSGFRLGLLARMNDPRESKDWIMSTAGPLGAPMPDWKALDKAVADYKGRVNIGCFSTDSVYGSSENFARRGYGHPRMWAQYADNHTGACIAFDHRKLDSAIRERYFVANDSWIYCDKVNYVDTHIFEPMNLVVKANEGQDISAAVKDHFISSGRAVFFTKHIDWQDEHEYRWVYYESDCSRADQNNDNQQFADIRNAVVGIVLGADYSAAHLPVAQKFADVHRLNGDVVKCEWDKLQLRLITFGDDDGRWTPVPPIRGRAHLSSGPVPPDLIGRQPNT